jgi:hypothetical protein
MPCRRYEYLELEPGPEAESLQSAGTIGATGSPNQADGPQATGLTTLADDSFGNGPNVPILPRSWRPETGEPR